MRACKGARDSPEPTLLQCIDVNEKSPLAHWIGQHGLLRSYEAKSHVLYTVKPV